jgi:hypothetical protein
VSSSLSPQAHKAAATARFRWWLARSRRRYDTTLGVAYVLAGMALAALLSGNWIIAALLAIFPIGVALTVGLIPVPRSRFAYYQRATSILRDWTAKDKLRNDRNAIRASEAIDHLEAMSVPERFETQHQRLIETMRSHQKSSRDRSIPLSESASEAIVLGQQARTALSQELLASASGDEEPGYIEALGRFNEANRERRLENYAQAHRNAERATEKLRAMHVPGELAGRHQQLVDALVEYTTAARRFNETTSNSDPRKAERAGREVENRWAELRHLWIDFIDRGWGSGVRGSAGDRA